MKFFSSNSDGNNLIAITIAIEKFFGSDQTLVEIFGVGPDKKFQVIALLKRIFDAPGGFAPAAWASPGCDDAALPGYSHAKYTEQVIPGYRKRPPSGAGWRKGGRSPRRQTRSGPPVSFRKPDPSPSGPEFCPGISAICGSFLRCTGKCRENSRFPEQLVPHFPALVPSFRGFIPEPPAPPGILRRRISLKGRQGDHVPARACTDGAVSTSETSVGTVSAVFPVTGMVAGEGLSLFRPVRRRGRIPPPSRWLVR